MLQVDTGTDPSEIVEIEPMTKGNMVHAVMEQLVGEWLALDAATDRRGCRGRTSTPRSCAPPSCSTSRPPSSARGNLLGNPHAWAIERELTIASLAHELAA